MLKIIRSQTPISPLGSAKAQKTLGVPSAWLNQTIDTSMHIILKITKTLPVEQIDFSQLKNVKPPLLKATQCSTFRGKVTFFFEP